MRYYIWLFTCASGKVKVLFLRVRVGLQKEAELLSASWIDRFSSFAANQEFGFFMLLIMTLF
jgi:hypothetical protein